MKIAIIIFAIEIHVLVKANCCHKIPKSQWLQVIKVYLSLDRQSSVAVGGRVELCSTQSFRDSGTPHFVAIPSPGNWSLAMDPPYPAHEHGRSCGRQGGGFLSIRHRSHITFTHTPLNRTQSHDLALLQERLESSVQLCAQEEK